jgi:hypothetical protein
MRDLVLLLLVVAFFAAAAAYVRACGAVVGPDIAETDTIGTDTTEVDAELTA